MMNIEELEKRYEKVSVEVFDAQSNLDGYMHLKKLERTLQESIDFHKSYAKSKLNLANKITEQSALMDLIQQKRKEKIIEEITA